MSKSKVGKILRKALQGIGNIFAMLFLSLGYLLLSGSKKKLVNGALGRITGLKYNIIQAGLVGDPLVVDLDYEEIPGLVEKIIIKAPIVRVNPIGVWSGKVKEYLTGGMVYQEWDAVEILLQKVPE